MNGQLQDLRYAARQLRKAPWFAITAIITLALGIGANTAVFSVINAVLLRPLPYPHPDRLVVIHEALPTASRLNVSWPDFVSWQEQNGVFEQMAAFRPERLTFTGHGEAQQIDAGWVSTSFFSLLGANTIRGRFFGAIEDKPGAAPVAVVSYTFWRSVLQGDPNVVGKSLSLDGSPFSIIGVLSPDFRWSAKSQVYVPIGLLSSYSFFTDRANHPGIEVLARMRPDVSVQRAQSDMNTIMDRLSRQFPTSNAKETAPLTLLSEQLIGNRRRELLILFAAVGLVLLLACANVAHLVLARATSRQHELAVRTALGAGRTRLMSHFLVEGGLLALLGGVAGLFLASKAIGPLLLLYPDGISPLREVKLNENVFFFTLAVCILVGLLTELIPMLQVAYGRVNVNLKDTSFSHSASKPHQRMRSALLVAEIAVAVVLSVGVGLLVRSFLAVLKVDPGFQSDHLLALDIIRPGGSAESAQGFFKQSLERIRQLPGVRSADAIMCPPLGGTCWTSPYSPPNITPSTSSAQPWTALNMVTPGYFETSRVRLLHGRFFTESDGANSTPVAIVNETMARKIASGGRIDGKLYVQYAAHNHLEVVGVVADVKQFGLEAPVIPEVYVPVAQMPVKFMTLMIRTSVKPGTLTHAASAAIQGIDKDQPVSRIVLMSDAIGLSMADRRFAMILMSLFGGLAVILAIVGTAAITAYNVAERTREFAVHIALGATPRRILQFALRRVMVLAAVGVLFGIGAALLTTRLLATMLYSIRPLDLATFVSVAMALSAVAVIACYIPARRATKIDPMVALRYE